MLGVKGDAGVRRSKVMVWMLKLKFEQKSDSGHTPNQQDAGKSLHRRTQALERATKTSVGSMVLSNGHTKADKVHLTSIQVVQSSNASNSKAWNEEDEKVLNDNTEEDEYATSSHGFEEQGKDASFLAMLPKEWKLEDLVVDKEKHKCEFRSKKRDWRGAVINQVELTQVDRL